MLRKPDTYLALNDLAVYYSSPRGTPRSRRIGGINALGFEVWTGVEGMAFVFTLKKGWFIGPLRLHALRLAGLRTSSRRREVVDAPTDGLGFAGHCLRLLTLGVPFGRVGDKIRLVKDDPAKNLIAGTFSLIRYRR